MFLHYLVKLENPVIPILVPTKNIITPGLAAALDRTGISSRLATDE